MVKYGCFGQRTPGGRNVTGTWSKPCRSFFHSAQHYSIKAITDGHYWDVNATIRTRPRKLCESQIFTLYSTLKNVHPLKNITLEKYSSLKISHPWKIFTLKIITPEKYSPPKNIHPWKIFTPEKYPLLKIFTPEKYSLLKNSQHWKIFTPGKYSLLKNSQP